MQENVCSITSNGRMDPQSGLGYSAAQNDQNGSQSAYAQHQPLEGCMYMNEYGQMCGPYPPEQLYGGLSTGFLPQNLAIYAMVGGKMANPVPLSFLKQFLSQLSFGIAGYESTDTKKSASSDKMVLPNVWLTFLSLFLRTISWPVNLPNLVSFCFLPIRLFQVKNHAGCLRMQKGVDTGHILLLNFPIGITVAISKIFQW
jgi:hypothetical protein